LWPFPGSALAAATATCRRILVYELNAGQMLDDVRIHAEDRSAIRFIGGVSQDDSGMRQGDLLDAAVFRQRVLAALKER
jgi:2-oxoglutarate ferredoxin oxidoreductase subunit alpha